MSRPIARTWTLFTPVSLSYQVERSQFTSIYPGFRARLTLASLLPILLMHLETNVKSVTSALLADFYLKKYLRTCERPWACYSRRCVCPYPTRPLLEDHWCNFHPCELTLKLSRESRSSVFSGPADIELLISQSVESWTSQGLPIDTGFISKQPRILAKAIRSSGLFEQVNDPAWLLDISNGRMRTRSLSVSICFCLVGGYSRRFSLLRERDGKTIRGEKGSDLLTNNNNVSVVSPPIILNTNA